VHYAAGFNSVAGCHWDAFTRPGELVAAPVRRVGVQLADQFDDIAIRIGDVPLLDVVSSDPTTCPSGFSTKSLGSGCGMVITETTRIEPIAELPTTLAAYGHQSGPNLVDNVQPSLRIVREDNKARSAFPRGC
jgi:hypothetical protein